MSYYLAKYRQCDVDKPRNLAKCVTVEWLLKKNGKNKVNKELRIYLINKKYRTIPNTNSIYVEYQSNYVEYQSNYVE